MILLKWEQLPPEMQTEEVRKYYEILKNKKTSLIIKRLFDIVMSLILLVIASPILLILSIVIKADSPGPAFFKQTRITQYKKPFLIYKYRSMVSDAEKKGTLITSSNDNRITKVGAFIRKTRLA